MGEVEQDTKTFLMLRDVCFGSSPAPGEECEALVDGVWTTGQFVRKVPLQPNIAKVRVKVLNEWYDGFNDEYIDDHKHVETRNVRTKMDKGVGVEVLVAGIAREGPGEVGPDWAPAILRNKLAAYIKTDYGDRDWGTGSKVNQGEA